MVNKELRLIEGNGEVKTMTVSNFSIVCKNASVSQATIDEYISLGEFKIKDLIKDIESARKEAKKKNKKAPSKVFTKKDIDFFGYLYGRWQDEKLYEDFNDYIKEAKKMLKKTDKFIKMTKRPFQMEFKRKGLTIKLKATDKFVSVIETGKA